MARGGGQIAFAPQPQERPNPLAAIMDSLAGAGMQYMQMQAQKEQIAMEKEKLKIAQDTFKTQQEQRAAEGQASLLALQSNPTYSGMIGGGGAQGTSVLRAPQLPQQPQPSAQMASAGGMAPQMPAPQMVRPAPQQRERLNPLPGAQGRLTPELARSLLPMLQQEAVTRAQLTESGARVAEANASTQNQITQGLLAQKDLATWDDMYALNTRRIEAEISSQNASTDASRASAARSRAEVTQIQTDAARAKRIAAANIADAQMARYQGLISAFGNPQIAAEQVFGTRKIPTRQELLQRAEGEIDGMISAHPDGASAINAYNQADRTAYATRLGIPEQVVQATDIAFERTGNAKDAAKAAQAAGLSKEDRLGVFNYLVYLDPSANLKLDDLFTTEERSWVGRVLSASRQSLQAGGTLNTTLPLGTVPTTRGGYPITSIAP